MKLSSTPVSYPVKIDNPTTSAATIQISSGTLELAGYYSSVNGVETFIHTNFVNSYLAKVVYGTGFNTNLGNERLNATMPPTARTSMQAAASSNPTENRVLDIDQVLQQVFVQFSSLKFKVKQILYANLTSSLADAIWGLVQTYLLPNVETIVNYFDSPS